MNMISPITVTSLQYLLTVSLQYLGWGLGGGANVGKCQNSEGTLRSGRVVPHPAPKNVKKYFSPKMLLHQNLTILSYPGVLGGNSPYKPPLPNPVHPRINGVHAQWQWRRRTNQLTPYTQESMACIANDNEAVAQICHPPPWGCNCRERSPTEVILWKWRFRARGVNRSTDSIWN